MWLNCLLVSFGAPLLKLLVGAIVDAAAANDGGGLRHTSPAPPLSELEHQHGRDYGDRCHEGHIRWKTLQTHVWKTQKR